MRDLTRTLTTAAAAMAVAVAVAMAMGAAATGAATAPPRVEDLEAPLMRVGFGSCNDQGMAQPLWPLIHRQAPELWLWMGDNIYGDIRQSDEPKQFFPPKMFHPAPPDVLRRRYAKLQREPGYQALVTTTPVIGIWDDHDYGINDGHKDYANREQSQQIFLDFLGVPADSPRRKQEGIYASHVVGSGDKTIKFILLDNRYHRDDYKTPNGDFLGDEQWRWLEGELMHTDAAFNVIVSGIQILPADRFFGAESWSRFPAQRQRLLNLILKSRAKGVILLSGDVHFAEINQVKCAGGKGVVTEMTSSGMTHSWMQFHFPQIKFFPALIFTFANMLLPWEFRPAQEAFYGYLNWGMIEIDWAAPSHPIAHVRVRGRDEKVKLEFAVPSVPVLSAEDDASTANATSCVAPRSIGNRERFFWQVSIVVTLGLLFGSIIFNVYVLFWLVKYFALRALGRHSLPKDKKMEQKKTQ